MGYLDYTGLQYLWGKLKEKFAPKSHSHDDRYYTEAEVNSKLSGKVDNTEAGANGLINKLESGTAAPVDDDLIITQWANHTTATAANKNKYVRRPMSSIWSYIKSKADGVYQPKGSYAVSGHTHDDRYYTESEIDTKLNGKAPNGHTHQYLSLYGARPANINFTKSTNGTGAMFHFVATSSTTTGKPPADSSILQLNWDNSGGWDSQLALSTTASPHVYYRNQQNGTWGNWSTLLDNLNYTDYAAKKEHTHSFDSIKDKPSAYPPSAHNQSWGTITGKPALMESDGYSAETIEALLKQVQGLSPRMGSCCFTKDTHVANTWWNFIYTPHRTGSGGDNPNYGTLLLFPMTGTGSSYIVRAGKDGSVKETRKIYTSGDKPTKSDVGLGNVDNTADVNKSVKYAISAGSAAKATTAGTADKANSVDWSKVQNKPSSYPPSSHSHAYLPLGGGTMTGQIKRDVGCSWIYDRDNAIVYGTSSGTSSGYHPVVGQKTPSGAWTIGTYSDERLIFDYTTDANKTAGTNKATQVYLPAQDGTIITSATIGSQSVNYAKSAGSVAWGNVTGKPGTFTPAAHTHTKSQITDFPASLKNPTALTIQTNGAIAATYDGSAAKTVNVTKGNIGLGNVDNTADKNKSVASAAKLTTARTVSGGSDITLSFNYDGSGNSTANIGFYSCKHLVGNTNNYPFHRFAKLENLTGAYTDKTMLVYITQDYNGGGFGICRLNLRTNNSSSASTVEAKWLVRSGLSADFVQVAIYNVYGKTYADAFIKTNGTYAGTTVRALSSGSRATSGRTWTLVDSNEVNGTTATDKKTSSECWKTIAEAGVAIHKQEYSSSASAIDKGYVASAGSSNTSSSCTGNSASATKLTSSAGSAIQPVYFKDGKPVAGTYTLGDASSKIVRTLGAVGNTGWANKTTDDKYVPTMSFMAYWNGAYSSTSSNLQYCDRGRFGTIVTKSSGDYATVGHTHDDRYYTETEVNSKLSGKLGKTENAVSSTKLLNDTAQTALTGTSSPETGLTVNRVYNNGYPTNYGNVISVHGNGSGQILAGWSGTSGAVERLYYRNKRDWNNANWSDWKAVAFTDDKPATAGTADIANSLSGLYSRSSQGWGVQTGTFIHGEGDSTSGDFAFRRDCPNSGQMSMVIDGRFYQNEGQYRVLDESDKNQFAIAGHTHNSVNDIGNAKTTTFAYSKDGMNYGDYTWLAGWNGYELRAINKNQFATAEHGVTASGSNYVRFGNGTQICWGYKNENNRGGTTSFAVAFNNTSYALALTATTASDNAPFITGRTTTSFSYDRHGTAWDDIQWIAVGTWK